MTRARLIAEAKRLFAEGGYAATSLEQIAQAAGVTKGAIYGHFSSKEELLLGAIEASPAPRYELLNDASRPVTERLQEFGRRLVSDEESESRSVAVWLEFLAALLRTPQARARYATEVVRRLEDYAGGDPDRPSEGTSAFEAWMIGMILAAGLQLYGVLMPEVVDKELRAKAMALLSGLYLSTEKESVGGPDGI